MKTLTETQHCLFDEETAGLVHAYANVSSIFIESLGFGFVRMHQIQNLKGDDAELQVFVNAEGKRLVKLCVTQVTHSEGDLLHISRYADEVTMPLLVQETSRFRLD